MLRGSIGVFVVEYGSGLWLKTVQEFDRPVRGGSGGEYGLFGALHDSSQRAT
jgi:hypothetical protein